MSSDSVSEFPASLPSMSQISVSDDSFETESFQLFDATESFGRFKTNCLKVSNFGHPT